MLALNQKLEPTLLEEISRPIVTGEQYREISAKYEVWARKSRSQTA